MTPLPGVAILDRGALLPEPAQRDRLGLMRVASEVRVSLFGQLVVVPVGFVSDGATIPRWARFFFDPWGRRAIAALVHDHLLQLRFDGLLRWPKWQIDAALFLLLKTDGCPDFEATVLFLAVRTRP
jgi:hypothetical protein